MTQRNDLSLTPATTDQRPVLERLWQLYRHDLSQFRGSMPDDAGLFTAGHLPSYLDDDPDHCCYLVRRGDDLAGFVLLRGLVTDVVGDAWTTQARPVPDKPHIPPDTRLFLRT